MSNPRQLLDHAGITPRKSLGQNFLHDPNTLERIVEIAALPEDITVLEIGPGTGALSKLLATRVRELIVVEADTRLEPVLSGELAAFDNVTFYWQDFLTLDLDSLMGGRPYMVVANLPYYITSKILRQLLDAQNRPQRLVLTVQKEVAERMTAEPGNLSILGVSVQFYGDIELHMRLNPAVFYPRPDVESAVIRIDVFSVSPFDVPSAELFFKVVRAGFSQKRKQLKNSLANGLSIKGQEASKLLAEAGIDAQRRAETLNLQEWAALCRAYGSR